MPRHLALALQGNGLSAAGYSVWTDTSYKLPLLASAVACIVGNLAYCLSFDTGSILLLLAGRLITGFGECPRQ